MIYYSLVFLFIILTFKKIIIIISLLPLKYYFNFAEQNYKDKQSENKNILLDNRTKEDNFRIIMSRYLQGYTRYVIIQVGYVPSHIIRNFVYRYILGVKLAKKAIIYYNSEIRSPYNLFIGRGSIIGDKSILDARNRIIIGENVNFSSCVSIWTEQHDYNDPYFSCNSSKTGPVIIEDRVWIGPNVTILPNITIGEGAVIGAGSVVTKDVPAFTLVGGIPARKISERNKNICYKFDGKPLPFY